VISGPPVRYLPAASRCGNPQVPASPPIRLCFCIRARLQPCRKDRRGAPTLLPQAPRRSSAGAKPSCPHQRNDSAPTPTQPPPNMNADLRAPHICTTPQMRAPADLSLTINLPGAPRRPVLPGWGSLALAFVSGHGFSRAEKTGAERLPCCRRPGSPSRLREWGGRPVGEAPQKRPRTGCPTQAGFAWVG
jgi:hypothetical protein